MIRLLFVPLLLFAGAALSNQEQSDPLWLTIAKTGEGVERYFATQSDQAGLRITFHLSPESCRLETVSIMSRFSDQYIDSMPITHFGSEQHKCTIRYNAIDRATEFGSCALTLMPSGDGMVSFNAAMFYEEPESMIKVETYMMRAPKAEFVFGNIRPKRATLDLSGSSSAIVAARDACRASR